MSQVIDRVHALPMMWVRYNHPPGTTRIRLHNRSVNSVAYCIAPPMPTLDTPRLTLLSDQKHSVPIPAGQFLWVTGLGYDVYDWVAVEPS